MSRESKRFPRGNLLSIEWIGFHRLVGPCSWWRPLYHEYSNGRGLYIGPLHITWRWFWHPDVAYRMGWNDCWMQQFGNKTGADLQKKSTRSPE